jgi:hypothetical protein
MLKLGGRCVCRLSLASPIMDPLIYGNGLPQHAQTLPQDTVLDLAVTKDGLVFPDPGWRMFWFW